MIVEVPNSVLNRINLLANGYRRGRFFPLAEDHHMLLDAAKVDPTSVLPAVHQLIVAFNSGNINSGDLPAFFAWMADLAEMSQILREKIKADVRPADMGYHIEVDTQNAKRLSEALSLQFPSHYFDICRQVLAGTEGCMFIVGAGFSYDSLAPLLKETRFWACHVLADLGVNSPKELYDGNDREAWQIIADQGWQHFQTLAVGLLETKEPSEQHRILARLFKDGIVRHIISFNWDDLIERAFLQPFNEEIQVINGTGSTSSHALWKLHGDIKHPADPWVLPYQGGRVFDELISELNREVLFTFIVGYREQEPIVNQKLISPLDSRGGIVRIGPSLPHQPPNIFSDDARSALRKLEAGFRAAVAETGSA